MTRKDFIAQYAQNSGLPPGMIKPWGVDTGSGEKYRKFAVPCHCKDGNCDGWAMVSGEMLAHHFQFHYHPDASMEGK